MVTEDPVDLNLTISPSSRKIPALLTKNSAQSCQTWRVMEKLCGFGDDDDGDLILSFN